MLVNLFRNKTPISVSALPILVVVGCISLFFKHEFVYETPFNWQIKIVQFIVQKSWLNYLMTVVLLSINAHQINRVYNANTFFSRDTTLPGFIYLLGIFTFDLCYFSFELIIHTALIGAMAALFLINRQESSKGLIFAASLCLGIAFIFEPFAIGFLLIVLLTLIILKPFIWREYLIALVGFALPTLYHLFFMFVFNASLPERIFFISLNQSFEPLTMLEMIAYSSLGLVSVIGIVKYIGIMRSQIVNFKKLSYILFLVMIITMSSAIFQMLFFSAKSLAFILPLGVLMTTHFLYRERAILSELLVIIWFVTCMINLFI